MPDGLVVKRELLVLYFPLRWRERVCEEHSWNLDAPHAQQSPGMGWGEIVCGFRVTR